jgi:hypothetical protein
VPGTRRLIVAPYVLTYREAGDDIDIIDFRDGRQRAFGEPDEGSTADAG